MAAAKKPVNKKGKTYYPPKTFDDDLVGLVDLYNKSGWAFTNVDVSQLSKDADEQRQERTTHDAVELEYNKVHATFGQAQEARHQRFSSALNAARGAFKNDKAVLAQLEKFKRSARRQKKATAGADK